jgi:5S rRNA maturation endonuclease (ribonuclease M5)
VQAKGIGNIFNKIIAEKFSNLQNAHIDREIRQDVK